MKKNKLAIFGEGGHSIVLKDCAILNKWKKIDFYNDIFSEKSIGNLELLINKINEYDGIIIAIGDNLIRKKKYELIKKNDGKIATLIHPTAIISPEATIAEGTVVCAGSIVNPKASIGNNCILNSGSIVEHDCIIEDSVHISPGAVLCGAVKVSNLTWIGANSIVREGVKIGESCIVGAGSVVLTDMESNKKGVGNPIKIIN